MPLTLAQLEAIQSDHLADDVAIDLERMAIWSEEQAAAYFESGGTVEPAATPSPPSPLGRKPRVALMHGTAANKDILKIQLAPLLTRLSEAAEIHFIEGGQTCAEDNPQVKPMRQFFGKRHVLKEYCTFGVDDRGWRIYPGLQDALAYVQSQLAALPGGGADALIGFSQGANLISCIVANAERTSTPLRCAVLMSPNLPGWAR
eukprot:1452554-Prymnesium_polylepis.1